MKNMTFDTSAEMTDIYDLLLRLGVTANYIGFFHTAFAGASRDPGAGAASAGNQMPIP